MTKSESTSCSSHRSGLACSVALSPSESETTGRRSELQPVAPHHFKGKRVGVYIAASASSPRLDTSLDCGAIISGFGSNFTSSLLTFPYISVSQKNLTWYSGQLLREDNRVHI